MHDLSLYEKKIINDEEFPVQMFENQIRIPGTYCHPHWHEHLELHYVLKGNGIFYCNQKPLPVKAGSLAIINSNEIHEGISYTTDFHALVIIFEMSVFSKEIANYNVIFKSLIEADLKINELVREGFRHWIPDDDYPGKLGAKASSQKEDYNFYYYAPTLIIASNRPNYENAMADCALALENIFLAAQSLGLGSCYINQLHWLRNDTKLRNYLFELGIPKEHTICSSAALGYIGRESPAPLRKEGTIHIIK